MLVTGSVIIGRREEGKDAGNDPAAGSQGGFRDETEVPLAEGVSSDAEVSRGESIELRRK